MFCIHSKVKNHSRERRPRFRTMAEIQQGQPTSTLKSMLPQKRPSTSQVIAVVTLVPVIGTLLTISGITLAATMVGLAVATPVFLIFSPVLVPAAITVALAVTGFLASGAFGLSGISSLSWIVNYMRGKPAPGLPEQWEHAKRRAQEAAAQMGQRGKEVTQAVAGKGQETTRT